MLKQQNARDQLQSETTSRVPVLVFGFSCLSMHIYIHSGGLQLEIFSEAEILSKLITPLS